MLGKTKQIMKISRKSRIQRIDSHQNDLTKLKKYISFSAKLVLHRDTKNSDFIYGIKLQ